VDPSDIKRIQEVLKKELEWATDKLVFKIVEDPSFDVIPYLGMGQKSYEMPSFVNPMSLTFAQKSSRTLKLRHSNRILLEVYCNLCVLQSVKMPT
jgi:hypothetical protein